MYQIVSWMVVQMEYSKISIQLNTKHVNFIQNNERIYYDGFVTGCMQIGNTKLICETVADSSILNTKTQPTQTPTTQAIQPTAVGES
jgi:hypothetical protein